MAIRKENFSHQEDFEADIEELISYFEDTNEVHAYPAAGVNVPIYILGSSTFSAHLAARLGLPYAFASHFAPAQLVDADRSSSYFFFSLCNIARTAGFIKPEIFAKSPRVIPSSPLIKSNPSICAWLVSFVFVTLRSLR